MKITFECELKEIIEAAIAFQDWSEKLEQPTQKELANGIIEAILAGMSKSAKSQEKEVE